jgi:hypothetical protein
MPLSNVNCCTGFVSNKGGMLQPDLRRPWRSRLSVGLIRLARSQRGPLLIQTGRNGRYRTPEELVDFKAQR